MKDGQSLWLIAGSIWVTIGIAMMVFFFVSRNARLKRKLAPPLAIGTALLFLGFVSRLSVPPQVFYVLIPAVVAMTFLNIRLIRFCDACGATVLAQSPFSRARFCSKCGAGLQ